MFNTSETGLGYTENVVSSTISLDKASVPVVKDHTEVPVAAPAPFTGIISQ
ncbi:hypothetical protein NBRC110019_01770 [Neptunitalea chrysea]|uniref:Uncharacterized protein n=1 Tax=Neptunitalea chrysea TaxID=1647581 RepID=A0A9W6B2I0_9FLAO|nr:hypothetical protein [Neptunitalea chrysea]GLB51138.1 hypothetical protein NBRC110019_01770 [Neptunitalea chrysea]